MSPSAFTRINLIACILAVALLLFLFIHPRAVITEVSETLTAGAQEVIGAVERGDWEAARSALGRSGNAFEAKKQRLQLFLNHGDLDELDAVLRGAMRLLEQEEDKQSLVEMERAIIIATHLREVETFTLFNLF